MNQKTYLHFTDKQLRGRTVRSTVELSNGVACLPPETLFTIKRKFKGFSVISDKCEHCGVRILMSRVDPRAVELVVNP